MRNFNFRILVAIALLLLFSQGKNFAWEDIKLELWSSNTYSGWTDNVYVNVKIDGVQAHNCGS